MTRVTTHVLDLASGRPAMGLEVRLERLGVSGPELVARAATDADGRVRDWLPEDVPPGRYRLVFESGRWHRAAERDTLFPEIVIHLDLRDDGGNHHVPLLLSPFGFTAYRGK